MKHGLQIDSKNSFSLHKFKFKVYLKMIFKRSSFFNELLSPLSQSDELVKGIFNKQNILDFYLRFL